MTDACCPPSATPDGSGLQSEPDLLDAEDLLADPTMSACCIREMKDRRRAEALRQKLSAVDISMQRQRAAASVLPKPPDIAQQLQEADQGSDWERESVSELEGLRAQRMQELKAAREQASQQQARGLGQLNDVPESRLLGSIEEFSGCCICHLTIDGHEPCNQLDELLQGLAYQYPGTLFIRTRTSRASPLRGQLQMTSLPGLMCFREGAVVGRAPLTHFGPPEEILEEEVVGYLRRLGVLHKATGSHRNGKKQQQRADDDSDMGGSDGNDELGSDKGEDSRHPPCELCGRRYPHEHIKAVYRSEQAADEDSDYEDGG